MKKFIPYIIPILAVALVACEPEEIPFRPQADVFIITKTVENNSQVDTLYGFALHVFANKPMTNVSVSPDNETDVAYQLEPYTPGYKYDYYYQTPDENFSQQLPFIGTYIFNILAETAETETLYDNLLDDITYPTDTIKYEYNADDEQMEFSWNEIDDADYLVIKLRDDDDDKTVHFQKVTSKGNVTSLNIKESTSGWQNGFQPTSGDSYILEIDIYMFETGNTEGLSLQAKTINLKTIVWAE